jgi:hypothetical protein
MKEALEFTAVNSKPERERERERENHEAWTCGGMFFSSSSHLLLL